MILLNDISRSRGDRICPHGCIIFPETTKSNHGNSTSNNAFSTSYVWKSRKVFVSLPSNLQAKTKKKI